MVFLSMQDMFLGSLWVQHLHMVEPLYTLSLPYTLIQQPRLTCILSLQDQVS